MCAKQEPDINCYNSPKQLFPHQLVFFLARGFIKTKKKVVMVLKTTKHNVPCTKESLMGENLQRYLWLM